ncbi:MAG: hypothetical protein TYPL_5140 [Candidatus Tyloplasma litorale]|nr:MAG: hypothetical protein TYPL_5140 [Mycoplasmatales bacterium]
MNNNKYKILFKYFYEENDKDKLIITFNNNSKIEILINNNNSNEEMNIEKLYDFIIENIENIHLEAVNKEEWSNKNIAGKVCLGIFEAINSEYEKILEDKRKKFNND